MTFVILKFKYISIANIYTIFKNTYDSEMPKPKVEILALNNYEEFTNYVENVKTKRNIYLFFTGSKKDNGRSWCIYCQLGRNIQNITL